MQIVGLINETICKSPMCWDRCRRGEKFFNLQIIFMSSPSGFEPIDISDMNSGKEHLQSVEWLRYEITDT